MSPDELKAELEKLSDEERGKIHAWLNERVLEETLERRIKEAEADPSILASHEEVMARLDAIGEKHRTTQLSPGSS